MRRIRYNFYAKISKSKRLNFANFGGRVEPHTFCTRKFIWVPSFGEHKHLNFEKRVEPHTFCSQTFVWVPSFGEPKGDNVAKCVEPYTVST